MEYLKTNFISLTRLLLLSACVVLFSSAESVADSVSGHSMTEFESMPIGILEDTTTPQVQINTTNDHQLFFKAYNDYSDLDGDGEPETTYKHSIDYYGYFDSYKCYTYDTGDERFEPVSVTNDKYCNAGGASGEWSGNFLNWASMTRIDTIRKILFGGHRRVDTYSDTVLERSFLPPDIHSFAKYYNGTNLDQLTPFSTSDYNNSTPETTVLAGFGPVAEEDTIAFLVLDKSAIRKGDYLVIGTATDYVKGWVDIVSSITTEITITVATVGGTATVAGPTNVGGNDGAAVVNHTRTGITLCNVTYSSLTEFSEKITEPPLIRVAAGDYSFWAAGEVHQCLWEEEDPGNNGKNYNNPEYSGMYAAQDNPLKADVGLGNFDYVARVQACVDLNGDGVVDDSDGKETCKRYPYGNYKPIGLLQEFGDDDQLLFGMIAGTYGKSTSGGDMIMPLFNNDGNGSNMCREINLNRDCDDDDNGNIDDLVIAGSRAAGDGTFKRVFTWVGGPASKQDADGVINSWSLYRIRGYEYGTWTYGSNQGDACPLSINFFGDSSSSQCSNWGNPFAEIYLTALRQWVGENAPNAYQALDKLANSVFDGLNYTPGVWLDPLSEENYCAPLSVINFSSSVISVDTAFTGETDELDTTALGIEKDLNSPYSSRELTRQIGEEEGIYESGKTWFVGETTADNSMTCSPKEITNLGDARGICPEGPGQRGGFRIAGMAWYAHTNDIRPDSLLSGHALKGTQTVDNYSVRLSDGSPLIEIPVPGDSDKKVTIIPSCINSNKDNYGCTLVDFKIVEPHTETTETVDKVITTTGHGKFLAIWEDSLQGNDYDLDAGGIIEYEITSTEIKITTAVTLEKLGHAIGHGYVISGTGDTDGLHLHSGTNGFIYIDPTGTLGCTDCYGGSASTVTYTLEASSAGILEDPLWYAAKWGGFTDLNDNKMPDLVDEWDTENNKTGDEGADGIPDNYFYASQPQELEDALRRTFNAILERTSSGTAAAVVSSNVRGEGALYQAFYEPLKKYGSKEARWIGTLQALWLDSAGYTREDCTPPAGYDPSTSVDGDGNQICPAVSQRNCDVSNGTLDDYCIDQVVQTYYDELEKRVRVRVSESNLPGTYEGSGDVVLKEINELSYLWNGREKLYLDGLSLTGQKENRIYSSQLASEGRYIMTWIDKDYDGELDSDEYIDFESAMFTAPASVPFGFFDVPTQGDAEEVVNYIRGVEVAGTRNRTIKYSSDDAGENVMRLGDIINSTPTIVGSPQEAFNLLYKDLSYTDFRHQYQDRRNVVYVGGNDGLLHAFNGGFYKDTSGTIEYSTIGTNCADNSVAVVHGLGAEMWAYAPMNLLSHLQWLKDNDYAQSHVYYIDGKPRVFDANIFPDDADHPNGWGTVLVVGMNLGGGEMEVDVDSDGSAADVTMRSAYIVFDITNPETAPILLGEIQIPDGSFSTVYPAVIAFRDVDDKNCDAGATACNRWYLVFGNGPNDISSYATDLNGKVYLFDLEQLTTSAAALPISSDHPLVDPTGLCSVDALTATMNVFTCDTGIAARFMGTPMVVDWELDFFSNTVYFGLVGNSDADTGRLIRFALNNDVEPTQWSVPETLFQADQPVLAQPVPAFDNLHNKWIFFGTGRYFTIDDKTSTATQSLYGIKDDGSGTVSDTNLVDVSNVEVYSDGTLTDNGIDMTGIATFDDLVDYVDDTDPSNPTNNKGWLLDLPPIVGTAGSVPATRNISRSTLLGGILFSSVFQPSVDPCVGEGRSRLYGLFYKTGTAYPGPTVFGTNIDTVNGVEKERSLKFFELGTGFATTPSLHSGKDSGEQGVNVFTQLSTGDVVRKSAETVHKVRTGRISWKN